MNRGDIWWVTFDPSVGGEIRKTRPAIIVSNDKANEHLNRIQVVPITSKIGRIYPCETLVITRGKEGKALADQLATVSKLRVKSYIGRITNEEMEDVEAAIRLQLAL